MTEKPKMVEISEEELAALKNKVIFQFEELKKKDQEVLLAKAREKKKEKKESQTLNVKNGTGGNVSEQKAMTSDTEPSVPTHGHEEGKPHYIGAWQQYCPTCGDKNPDFKDETKCKDCGTHLGAVEIAEKLKACPNCGGHNAERIKP